LCKSQANDFANRSTNLSINGEPASTFEDLSADFLSHHIIVYPVGNSANFLNWHRAWFHLALRKPGAINDSPITLNKNDVFI
jgi:hypothetical protein